MNMLMWEATAHNVYKGLFSVRADVHPQHIKHLGSVYYWAQWLDAHRPGQYPMRDHLELVRQVLHHLEQAFTIHPVEVGTAIRQMMFRMRTEQTRLFNLLAKVAESQSATTPDARIEPLAAALQALREAIYPSLMAPIAVAKAMRSGGAVPSGWIDQNSGRATTLALKDVTLCRALLPTYLDLKVSKHIRNAVSHGHVRILSGDKVEFSDFDGQGRRTFGPKVFTRAELVGFVDEWGIKMGACFAALCIFDVNNHHSLLQRCPPPLPTEPLREDLEKQILSLAAAGVGLSYVSHTGDSVQIEVKMTIAPRTIHGMETFTWGGDQFTTSQDWLPQRQVMSLEAALIRLGESTLDVTLPYETATFVVVENQPEQEIGRAAFEKAALVSRATDPSSSLVPLQVEAAVREVEISVLAPGPIRRWRTAPENRMRRN